MYDEFVPDMDGELEEIDVDEVELVVTGLDDLIEQVRSDTIKVYLHAACHEIAHLIMDEEEEDEDEAAEAA